jgi:hypothetical protein
VGEEQHPDERVAWGLHEYPDDYGLQLPYNNNASLHELRCAWLGTSVEDTMEKCRAQTEVAFAASLRATSPN